MYVSSFILKFIASLSQALVPFFIMLKFKNNYDKKVKVVYLFLNAFMILFSGYFIPNQVRFLYSLTMFTLINYFILKIRNKDSILLSFLALIIMSLSEIIVTISFVFCGINSDLIVNNSYLNVLVNVLIGIISIIILSINLIKTITLKVYSLIDKYNELLYYLIFVLLLIYVIVSKNGLQLIFKSSFLLNLVLTIGLIIMIIVILYSEMNQANLKEMNRQINNHIIKYEKIITEQGKANHEFKNQLMVIKGYAEMNSPKLLDYLNNMVEDVKKTKSTYMISQLNNFPDGGIKGLIYYKLSIMEDKNIKYNFYVDSKLKNKMKKMKVDTISNITKILGVLLDNAIDAASMSRTKNIDIEVVCDNNGITFMISNTFKGKINSSKIGTGYTTKGRGHGYGLRLVKDIIKNNDNFILENNIEKKIYISKFYVQTKKKK